MLAQKDRYKILHETFGLGFRFPFFIFYYPFCDLWIGFKRLLVQTLS